MKNEKMKNRVALITGGANGMGKATCLAFAAQQCTIIIVDVKDDAGKEVAAMCEQEGGKAEYIHCDLFQLEEIEHLFQYIMNTYGRLDYAINNAGFGHYPNPMGKLTDDEVLQIFGINSIANARLMIRELNIMEAAGFGRIITTTSGAGLKGSPNYSVYCAAKHSIVGMTKSAAVEYATKGITVNAIAPGAIETELMATMKAKDLAAYEASCKSNPIGRMGRPEEIAHAMCFLCDDNSAFINGVVLPVDSGVTAGK